MGAITESARGKIINHKESAEWHDAEARTQGVVETLSDAIITIDEASNILSVNPAAEKIFGYTIEEMRGAALTMLMPEYMRHLHEVGIRRYAETGEKHIPWEGVELPGLHKSGREIALEISFGEFADDSRRYFTGVVRDVSARRRIHHRLAAQYAVTRILSETATLSEATPLILQAVCEGLGWEMGALWRVDKAAACLVFVKAWHAPSVDVAEFERFNRRRTFARGEGLPGRVWESGAPAWVSDLATNTAFPRSEIAARSDLHAAFAFPILSRGEVLGAIEFLSREVRAPDPPLLEMMSSVGSQIGQVIERRRAEDERAQLQERIIQMQDAQLAELSTPLIPVTDRVVVMPLIGAMDAKRAERMVDALLRGVAHKRVPFAIVDITGVSVIDTHVANALVQVAQAARLLGTEVVLTGIRPGVARSLLGLGVDLQGITSRKTLQSGLAYALNQLRRH